MLTRDEVRAVLDRLEGTPRLVALLHYGSGLRLLEARQIMLAEMRDAVSTAYRVGYESASQFSREYARVFGNPPGRDIKQLMASRAGA